MSVLGRGDVLRRPDAVAAARDVPGGAVAASVTVAGAEATRRTAAPGPAGHRRWGLITMPYCNQMSVISNHA